MTKELVAMPVMARSPQIKQKVKNSMPDELDQKLTAPLPECSEATPFVLLWAEKTAIDVLKDKNVVFSEAVNGLSGDSALESAETTGSNPEGADTTFS